MEFCQGISPKPVGIKQVSCTQLKRKADIPISSFAEKDLGPWEKSWSWASNVPVQQKQPKASWTAVGALLPAG